MLLHPGSHPPPPAAGCTEIFMLSTIGMPLKKWKLNRKITIGYPFRREEVFPRPRQFPNACDRPSDKESNHFLSNFVGHIVYLLSNLILAARCELKLLINWDINNIR